MAMAKLAVSGGSVITAPQWRDFWEKVELNKINSKNFQEFLDNPNCLSDSESLGLISLSRAKKILGRNKILTAVNYNKIWRENFCDFSIRYTEEDLIRFASENEKNNQDWRLVFYGGQAIIPLRHRLGVDSGSQPCFSANYQDWFLRKHEEKSLNSIISTGYYLVNFYGRFKGLNHDQQESSLICMNNFYGDRFVRTDPNVFAETLFSIFYLTRERLAVDWSHWTSVKAFDSPYVHVGKLSFEGLVVGKELKGVVNSDLRVSLCLMPR